MDDLIKREDALSVIHNHAFDMVTHKRVYTELRSIYKEMQDMQGHVARWVYIKENAIYQWECSKCHSWHENKENYCGHCGARMGEIIDG